MVKYVIKIDIMWNIIFTLFCNNKQKLRLSVRCLVLRYDYVVIEWSRVLWSEVPTLSDDNSITRYHDNSVIGSSNCPPSRVDTRKCHGVGIRAVSDDFLSVSGIYFSTWHGIMEAVIVIALNTSGCIRNNFFIYCVCATRLHGDSVSV